MTDERAPEGLHGATNAGGDLSNKRVGVCLSAGYFGFFAHLGFMRALRAAEVQPAALTGCSAGALLGAMWSSGMDADTIEAQLFSLSFRDLLDPPAARDLLEGPFGLIGGERIERRLQSILPAKTFEECPIPFSVTGFDLGEAKLHRFDEGPLAPAVRASISMPGMFSPVRIGGHAYWDGGVVEKVPLAPLLERGDLDVIVICYLSRRRRGDPGRSLIAGLRCAVDSHVLQASRRAVRACRRAGVEVLVLQPAVPKCGPLRLGRGAEIAQIAEAQTRAALASGTFGCQELDA